MSTSTLTLEENIRQTSAKLESTIDTSGQPIKPYLPALSRFLVVVTFYEDALRILLQWSDRRRFLEGDRGFSQFISRSFLLLNVVVMLTFSSSMKKHVNVSVYTLSAVIVSQAIGYGLVFNLVSVLVIWKMFG